MKNYTLILIFFLTVVSQTRAQSESPGGTEVVVPWAASFYTGKGTANVQFCDSLNGVAFWKNYAEYSITTDGGETWRDGKLTSQLDKIMEMFPIGRDTLVAIRDSQYVFHSYNAGETWTHVASLWEGERFAYGLLYNHKHGILFPKEGGMLRSTDLGASWNAAFWPYSKVNENPVYDKGYLFVIERFPPTPGILYSTDNGATWVRVELPTTLNGYRKVGKSDNGFFVVSTSNMFYLLSMTGEIIQAYRPGGTDIRGGYGYVSDREIYALDNVGWGNRLLHRFSLPDTVLQTVTIGNNSMNLNYIIPTTHDKLVIYTRNVGKTDGIMTFHKHGHRNLKIEQFDLPGESEATTLFFVNGTKGFAGRSDGTIIMTTDGGGTWQATTTPAVTYKVKKFIQRSETEFVAIYANGQIVESPDGGANWNPVVSNFHKTIVSASFAGRDTIFVCSNDSLYFTDPAWQQFTPVNTGFSGGYFSDVCFYDRMNGSAIYQHGYFESKSLVTSDGGKTWTATGYSRQMVSLDPATLGLYYYIASEFSVWYEGGQGGSVNQEGVVVHTAQRPGGLIGMIYQSGQLFYNFGERAVFRRVFIGGGLNELEVAPGDANTTYALVGGNRLFRFRHESGPPTPSTVLRRLPRDRSPYEYQNLRFSWEEPWTVSPITEYNLQLALGDTSNIVNDITGIDSTSVTVSLGADSALYFWRVRAANSNGWGSFNRWFSFRSSTLAYQPTLYTTPLRGDLTAAIILPDGRLIVANNYGEIARTDQLPGNWTTVASGTTYPILRFYYDPNNNLAFYLTNGNFLGYSGNRGFTWGRKEAPFGSIMITAVAPLKPNRIFGSGTYGSIFRAVASPDPWTKLWFAPAYGDLRHINTLGTNLIAGAGDNGNITISNDGGETFRYVGHGAPQMYKRVSFAPDSTIVVLNQYGSRKVSTDLGETWTSETSEVRAPVRDMITQNGISAVIDTLGGIYTATSPFSPWRFSKLPEGVSPMGVEISGDTILITARGNKLYYLKIQTGNPVGVYDEPVIPGEFTLAQNFPNPFNPETVIRFVLPVAGYAKGVVYDFLGREVATLVDGETRAGTHEIKFDANGLPSGVYIFRLETGKTSAAVKMVLLR
ncbi:MAG: T9SS type A sorting domain-containing protein [Bacteroidetes bacterium]|nr:T9SS type A sorting domain-containing protein [Bacteroidota bacterium]